MTDTASHPPFGLTDLLLLTMAVIWAINFSVVKFATHSFNADAFAALRVVATAIFFTVLAAATGGITLARRDIVRLLLLGVIGNGLYQLCFVHGLARTRAGNAALIVGAAPAFIALTARLRGLERVRRMTLAGIGLSVIGVGLVILGTAKPTTGGETTLLGSLLIFCGVLCWTAFTVLLQPYTRRVDVVQLSAVTMVGGAVPLLLASTPALIATDWTAIGRGAWLALAYASVLSMGLAYLFWYRGLRVLGATRTAVYTNVQPIIALAVAWAFLSEIPTVFQGIGAVTIIAGVFLTRT